MATVYTWNVNTMDTAPSEDGLSDVVKVIHWRLSAYDGTHTADTYSTLSLEAANSESFTAFADLTEAQVISWVESKLDVDALKAGLDAQLERLANPPIVVKQGPWIATANTI
jgi:hypothetical protein